MNSGFGCSSTALTALRAIALGCALTLLLLARANVGAAIRSVGRIEKLIPRNRGQEVPI
jgi:hypothetical protein